jgi:hypothetical protein
VSSYEEPYDPHCSSNIIQVIKSTKVRWAGYVARMVKMRDAMRGLVGEPEGKRKIGRPRRGWEYIIEMCHQEVR